MRRTLRTRRPAISGEVQRVLVENRLGKDMDCTGQAAPGSYNRVSDNCRYVLQVRNAHAGVKTLVLPTYDLNGWRARCRITQGGGAHEAFTPDARSEHASSRSDMGDRLLDVYVKAEGSKCIFSPSVVLYR